MSVEDMVAAREGFEQWRRGDFSSIDESSSQAAEATSLFTGRG